MRFLILAHLGDVTALRVSTILQTRHGAERVKLVSAEELALAPNWAHRLEDTRVTTEVRLSDGISLESGNIGVVFNRLLAPILPQFESANAMDRDYAIQEMNALCLSWLASLPCPVVNTPTPMGLGGPARSHAEWLLRASEAGLPARGYFFTTDPRWRRKKTYSPHQRQADNLSYSFETVSAQPISRQPIFFLEPLLEQRESVIVAGDNIVGSLSGLYSEQLKNFARSAGCDFLEVMFSRSAASNVGRAVDENWIVCGANPFPQVHGAKAVEAIVHLLECKS